MKLIVGERLEGAGPAQQPGGYVITGVVRETAWHGLYAAKKIFYNFDFTAKRVRETDEVEWLDVFLRANRYPYLDDPAYVQARRALARAEVRAVLGNRHSNLWPEPLDLLEIENTRDPFTFGDDWARVGEPILVYTRPTGRFTPEWRQQILPVSSILSVLAELLEFMRQAHAEGLLLLGLGPSSLLIDASDRIHYLGTEMVLSQQSALLKDLTSSAVWQRLYPAERFASGYSAPECFDPARRPDVRSDLYSWGTLAFGLLTGAELTKLAQEQGRPWQVFGDAHWTQLEKVLGQLPKNSVQGWAEQLGVEARGFLQDWPRKFLTVLRMLLDAEPGRRPSSAQELLKWLVDPPPPPVAGVVALHIEADMAKLLLDCTGVEAGLDISIQCTRNEPARLPSDGETVVEGPVRPIIGLDRLPLTDQAIYYTVFTRRKQDNGIVHSRGVSAELWQPNEKNLRAWVEEQAVGAFDAQNIPTRVGMVLGALDFSLVSDALLGSTIPRLRSWVLRRIEQVLRGQGFNPAVEGSLWRCLRDPHVEMRQAAATTLWSAHPNKSDALLVRLIEALEAPPLEAPIALAHFLRHLQLPEERIRATLQRLETQRPTECPLCKKTLTHGERGAHLQTEHGYVLFEGDLLPAEVVIARLWERVFERPDRAAHEELVGIYLNLPGIGANTDAAAARYVEGLHRFLLGQSKESAASTIPVALPYSSILSYQMNLRHSASFTPIVRTLLASPHQRLRELGSQSVLPSFQTQLRLHPMLSEMRRLLATVSSDIGQTDLRIDLCRQLGQLGVDAALVNDCIAQLQEERLVVCPDCQASVKSRDLELHMRRAHEVFQFRGTRRTYIDTRDAILKAVCTSPTDLAAWKSLQSLAADKHPQDTNRYLVVWLYQFIKDVDAELRGPALTALADVLVSSESAASLLPLFVGPSKNASWELLGQRLGLELCTRLPPPIPAPVIPALLPLLDHKELPRRVRENATLTLLRSVDRDRTRTAELLRAYVGQSSKKRGMEKLQQLEQRFGHSPALDLVVQELDDELRMACPRCEIELRKKDMVAHLWDKHRLILDGQRVREPWRVIEDWIVDYGLEKDPQVLQRCRELALKDDPSAGLARLQRLLYRRGLRDRELLTELRSLVKTDKATLCPHCCASVPIESDPELEPLVFEESCLEGYGYKLEALERGLVPALRIESPEAILFRGREPGRWMTRVGGILLLTGPLVVITFIALRSQIQRETPSSVLAGLALGIGMLAAGFLYLIWPGPRSAQDRLIKSAWKLLVPEMLQDHMGKREWSFLNGLLQMSDGLTNYQPSRDLLLECCEEASDAARNEVAARICLASLSRRCLADMRERGQRPFDIVLTLAAESFKGKLPLSSLSELYENFHGRERSVWTKSELNYLTILTAHHAGLAEVDTDDWLNLGRAFPVLHAVLNLESRWHWLQFFAIWTARSGKLWEKAGPALTMLELAEDPAEHEEILAYYSDVLLFAPGPNLVVGSKGIWLEGICVTTFSANTEISVERGAAGFELTIGKVCVRYDESPRPYLDEIKRWLRWYFFEFVPVIANVAHPMSESRHRMWQLSKVECPECKRPLVPCLGDLGVVLR